MTEASLSDFVAEVVGSSTIRVEESYGNGFVRLMVDEAERRQAAHDIRWVEDAVIELLRNARDAHARNIFLATARSGDRRTLVALDDGDGIPEALWERVFEARVTSKLDTVHTDRWGVHGRGMALFSIAQNAETAHVVTSAPGLGTSVEAVFQTGELQERKDQSTWPSCGKDESGRLCVQRGPHNILRACSEFALEEKGQVSLFVGSPAEVCATMLARGRRQVGPSTLLFVDDPEELPVTQRVLVAYDAASLVRIAGSVGLTLSERNAHRVLSGVVRPVRSVSERLTHRSEEPAPRSVDLERDRRGLRLSDADAGRFQRLLERDFSFLEDRYYLSLREPPRVSVKGNQIRVVFEVDKGQEG